MKNIVEIYHNDKLIKTESNLLVDGFGELLVDILTLPSSIPSGIYDASNFRVNAISFGKSPEAYKNNDHAWGSNFYNIFKLANPGNFIVSGSTSSYNASIYMTQAPSVNDILLNGSAIENLYASDIFALLEDPSVYSAIPSSTWEQLSNGQNLNYLQFGDGLYTYSAFLAQYIGSYAPSNSIGFFIVSSFSGITGLIPPADLVCSGIYTGVLNSIGAISKDGFIRCYQSSAIKDPTSGLIFSGSTATLSSFYLNPVVDYSIRITSGDLGFLQLFGGIQILGLWGLDIFETLKNIQPPFTWINATGDTERVHRLLAKKVFLENLCYIEDDSGNAGSLNYGHLLIRWRFDFNLS